MKDDMKLADLTRPELRSRIIRDVSVIACLMALFYATWTELKSLTLLEANLTLVEMLDTQLSANQARLELLQLRQDGLLEALREGDVITAAMILGDDK